MAEILSAVRPSKVGYNDLVTSTQNPISRLFDTNDENYAYTASGASRGAFLGGFDFSAIPDNATIKNISLTIKGRSVSSSANIMYGRLVKDPSSNYITGFTDLGDGQLQFWKGTTLVTQTIDFPIAASACTVDFLKSGGLYVRLYQDAGPNYVYAVYLDVTYEVPVSYTLTVNATEGGTVTGGGTYENGTTATLTATPSTGYKFKQWSDGNTANPRTITVAGNATYTAQFERLTYNISASASPAGGGTVSGAGVYSHGDTATLTATPNAGYLFSYWRRGSDGLVNYSNPLSVQVTESETYTAIFEKSSSTYDGAELCTGAYIGTKKLTVYCGTTKVL